MPFTLPPLSLPTDIIQKQMNILKPSGVDAAFLAQVSPISAASGLFTNPFGDAMAQFESLTGEFTALAGSVPVGIPMVQQMAQYMNDMQQQLCNIGTNIVPMTIPVSDALGAGLQAAAAGLPGISAQDAPVMGSFLKSLGSPSLGTVMNVGLSQYSLNQLKGVVDAANPLPLMTQYSQHLTDLTGGATALIGQATQALTAIQAVTKPEDILNAITSGLASIESTLGSAVGGAMATFGGGMFSAIKDQMTSGLSISMRHMIETNFGMKYMLTGLGTTGAPGYTGLLPAGIQSAVANFPSNINVGHIIP